MILIHGGTIVDDGYSRKGYILVDGDRILKVGSGDPVGIHAETVVDASGAYVIPGVIDDQVHFRQPGAEHKADIASESRAAAAGGVTSFMDMPNTSPQTVTCTAWQEKMNIAAASSAVNYSFFFGATNSNMDQIHSMDKSLIPGLKVFMGSSTGGMLVDDTKALSRIFAEAGCLVAIHSEDEKIVRANLEAAVLRYGDDIPISMHPIIRSREACVRSTDRAMELASRYGTRLHILHVSTAAEISLLSPTPLDGKQITAEACIPHIRFCDLDYARLGKLIKCNPAIKSEEDRSAVRTALSNGRIDIVATDHAPHLLSEKVNPYTSSPSGMPMVQHSLPVMLSEGYSIRDVVSMMSNRVADLYHISQRGYLREGYYADIAVVRKHDWQVSKDNILYKCGWSPLEGDTLNWRVDCTLVSGRIVYREGEFDNNTRGMALQFQL